MSSRVQADMELLSNSAFGESNPSKVKIDPIDKQWENVLQGKTPKKKTKQRQTTRKKADKKENNVENLLVHKKLRYLKLYFKRFDCCKQYEQYLKPDMDASYLDNLLDLCKSELSFNSIFDNGMFYVNMLNDATEQLGNMPFIKKYLGVNSNPLQGLSKVTNISYKNNKDTRNAFDSVFIERADWLASSPTSDFMKQWFVIVLAVVQSNKMREQQQKNFKQNGKKDQNNKPNKSRNTKK